MRTNRLALVVLSAFLLTAPTFAQQRLDDILERGTISELEGKRRVYVWTNDDSAYEIINRRMEDCECFDIVRKPEKAQFVILYVGSTSVEGMSPRLFGYGLTFDGSNAGTFLVLTKSEESTPDDLRARQLFKRQYAQNYSGGVTFDQHPARAAVEDFIVSYKRVNKLK